MDAFVKIKKHKNPPHSRAVRKFYANALVVDEIAAAIGRAETICVYGGCGVGKSFIVDALLEKSTVFEMTSEHLRSRSAAIDIMTKLRTSAATVVFDDFEVEWSGFREIHELVVVQKQRLSRGATIFIARMSAKFEKIECFRIGALSVNDLVRLGQDRCGPTKKNSSLRALTEAAKSCHGNIQNFLTYIEFSDKKDIFKTPKDFAHELLCSDVRWPGNPIDYIGVPIAEHGYTCGIIHENYLDTDRVNTSFADIADWLSHADVLDTLIYEGDWEMSKFFSLYGIIMPALKIEHSLVTAAMRPGSAWTKFSNYKMRLYKFRSLTNRKVPVKVDMDYIQTFQTYNLHRPSLKLLTHYGFESPDLDVINHLCVKNKLKSKHLTKLKKELKHECEKSRGGCE